MVCIQKAATSLSQTGCEDKCSGKPSVVYCELDYSIVYMLHAICVYSKLGMQSERMHYKFISHHSSVRLDECQWG